MPCRSTAKGVSFEWSHHRISSTDSKVRTTLHVLTIDSGSKRVLKINSKLNQDCDGLEAYLSMKTCKYLGNEVSSLNNIVYIYLWASNSKWNWNLEVTLLVFEEEGKTRTPRETN